MFETLPELIEHSGASTDAKPPAERAQVHVHKARLQDARDIFDLVNSLSGDGTLLRRSYAEVCENIRDFTVAEIPNTDDPGGSWAVARCICTDRILPRSAPLFFTPGPAARVPAPPFSAPCSPNPKSTASPPPASSLGCLTSSGTSASASPNATPCPTRSIRIARPVRASTPAMRSPW